MKRTFIVTVDIDDEEVNKVRNGIEYAILDCLSLKPDVVEKSEKTIATTTRYQVCQFIKEIGGISTIKNFNDEYYLKLTSADLPIYKSYCKRNPEFEEHLLHALKFWNKINTQTFKEYYINFIDERESMKRYYKLID